MSREKRKHARRAKMAEAAAAVKTAPFREEISRIRQRLAASTASVKALQAAYAKLQVAYTKLQMENRELQERILQQERSHRQWVRQHQAYQPRQRQPSAFMDRKMWRLLAGLVHPDSQPVEREERARSAMQFLNNHRP